MRKATALTNFEDSTPDEHKQTTDPTDLGGVTEQAGDETDAGGPGVRRGVKLGALAAGSSMVLALALGGSSTPNEPAAAAPTPEPQAAVPAAELPMVDMADRAIAAARSDRSTNRMALAFQQPAEPEPEPEPEVIGKRYATVDLNVRTKPDEDAKVVAVLDFGDKITATDVKEDGWRLVLYKDKERWVKSQYLSKRKPRPKGPSNAPCPSGSGGSGMESGLTSNAVKVHRAVCAAFPSVSTYGGIRGGGGNHGTGHAVDIMVSSDTGDAIAAYVRQHASKLGVTEVIWRQRIWTTQRASEGWRPMSDRGSATDNHYDHVHVTVR